MMNLGQLAKALRVAGGILVKEMTAILGPFLLRVMAGLAIVAAIIYGLILWHDPQHFEKEDEASIRLHSYAEIIHHVIPSLQEMEPFEPKTKMPEDKFIVWYFGEHAEYFSRTSVRPLDKKRPGFETHVGFGGVEFPAYTFHWDSPNTYLEQFYSDDLYWERAGFSGKLPWPNPRTVVLIKPVETGGAATTYTISNPNGAQQAEQITLKRFAYKVWLYDVKSKEVVGYRSFLPDPWPDSVSFRTFTRRGRNPMKDREGNLIARGDTNYIGSNRELFAWVRSIYEVQDAIPYVSEQEARPRGREGH